MPTPVGSRGQRLLSRIFLGVQSEFLLGRADQVDPGHVCKTEDAQENVRHFVSHITTVGVEGILIPSKEREEFASLACDQGREVPGRMVFLPVPGACKILQLKL